MRPTVEDVRDQALLLTPRQRMQLVQELHASLMTADERATEEAWLDEAERRLATSRASGVKTTPGEEAVSRLREKYGRTRVRAGR